MASLDLIDHIPSLFDEESPATIAKRVYYILRDPISWLGAHSSTDYLDMAKVKYRTYQLEFPDSKFVGRLPSLFTDEFGAELGKYVNLVDRHGNQFEVIAEKDNGAICFTHGWTDIRQCYFDSDQKGCWASVTYIKPKLFILVLKDRHYRDLMVKYVTPLARLRLSHDVFGPENNPGWAGRLATPYSHSADKFAFNFIVVLTHADINTGFLDINYGFAAREIVTKESVYIRLVDDKGLEWFCTVDVGGDCNDRLKLAGKWKALVRVRGYEAGNHLMFGAPAIQDGVRGGLLFVRKIY